MNYQHFIITQFNLKQFVNSKVLDEDKWIQWTRERIPLFRKFCLSSIEGQSTNSFKWLLYFDKETPSEFDSFIAELKTYSWIKICYRNGHKDFLDTYMEEIPELLEDSTEWVVTSRIDNDDSLNKFAIERIQERIVPIDNYLISLASGYVLNLENNTLSHYYYPKSPFLTFIESRNNNLKGVFAFPHTKWKNLALGFFEEIGLNLFNRKKRKVDYILRDKNWIQVFHGGNVSNSFYRGVPVLKEKKLSDFSLSITTKKLPLSRITKYANYPMWKRYFKCMLLRFFFRR